MMRSAGKTLLSMVVLASAGAFLLVLLLDVIGVV